MPFRRCNTYTGCVGRAFIDRAHRLGQDDYYAALAAADRASEATPFVEFMLHALATALGEAIASDQVSDQAGDQVDEPIAPADVCLRRRVSL